MELPTAEDIFQASKALAGIAHRTPVLTSTTLNAMLGAEVFFKCENLQRAGAFKFRGACYALSQLNDKEKLNGVIAYSSGNHAGALALAGKLSGVNVQVVMPKNAPPAKIAATRDYGATLAFYDPETEEREEITDRLIAHSGRILIPPFNHPHIIAGAGTAALELIEEAGPLDEILAPCGGGGLLSGTALMTKHLLPECRVVGVEPEGADNGTQAFETGVIQIIPHPKTKADGLKPKALGKLTHALILKNVDEMIRVSEDEIREALLFLWSRMKLVVEPSGATALAPLLSRRVRSEIPATEKKKRVGVILSGGNADIPQCGAWLGENR